ncbi:MAG: hypothetical protein Q8P92_04905 [Candidatus Daviesbacteria bacterium]|nr:hypothetical protein [Candidatus Daviesbacteria bacterium]
MQSHERPIFTDLASQALNARPAFRNLPQTLQLEVTDGVTQLITDLDRICKSSWNNVTFSGWRILVFSHPYAGDTNLAQSLRQQIKDCGMHPKTAAALVNGSLRDSVMMIQSHVTTMEELKRILGKFERGKAGSEGRTFHSNEVGPPDTI